MDRLILLAALLVAVLPGAALAAALRVRSALLAVAVVPTASIGVLLLVASATGLLGLPFTAAVVAVPVLVLLGIGGWHRFRAGRPRSTWTRPVWRASRLPAVAGGLLVLAGTALGVRTWLRGFGGLDRIAQEHDMITHQLVVAYTERTGRAAPWQITPVDLLTGEPVTFYPNGGHLAPALLAGLGPGAVPALNALIVVYLAVGWTAGVAVLSAVTARQLGNGRDTAWLVAGTAAAIAPALYRPAFQLMHDGGIYPGALTLALAPGLLAAFLLAARERRPGTVVLLGLGAAGMLAAHPSGAVTVGLSLLAWLAGDLVDRRGRTRLRRLVPVLTGAAVVAGLAALPLLLRGGSALDGVSGFPPDSSPEPFASALGSAVGLAYGGYLDPARATGQTGLTVLYLAGVLAVARARRGLGVVAAWATWVAVTTAAMLSPGTGVEAPVTGFFYNALLRTWAHVGLFVPTLAALAVVAVVTTAVRAVRRRLPVAARGAGVASVLVLAVVAGLIAMPVRHGVDTNTRSVAERYADPEFHRVDPDDLAAAEFLRGRVAPGERVLNSANDGSTFLYVVAGIPVVNTSSLGTAADPDTVRLLRSFRDYPHDPAVRAALRRLDVGWVYVDSEAPGIGARGAPYGWVDGTVPYTVAPGLSGLDGLRLPGLSPAFRQGSVSVHRLDLDLIGPPG